MKIKNEHYKHFGNSSIAMYARYLSSMAFLSVFTGLVASIPIALYLDKLKYVTTLPITEIASNWGIDSFYLHYFISIIIIFFTLPLIPYWLRKRSARKWLYKAYNGVLNNEHKIDYFNYTPAGGIALDIDNKTIIALNFNISKESILIPIESIESYYAWSPGFVSENTQSKRMTMSRSENILGDILGDQIDELKEMSDVAKRNMIARRKAASQTGLYFELDDLNNPSYLIPMFLEEAKRWEVLLKRFLDNRLEKPLELTLFPT